MACDEKGRKRGTREMGTTPMGSKKKELFNTNKPEEQLNEWPFHGIYSNVLIKIRFRGIHRTTRSIETSETEWLKKEEKN